MLSSAAAHTVGYAVNTTIASLVSTTDLLNMTGGKLTITNGATFGTAGLNITGASLSLAAASSMAGQTQIGGATLTLNAGSTAWSPTAPASTVWAPPR